MNGIKLHRIIEVIHTVGNTLKIFLVVIILLTIVANVTGCSVYQNHDTPLHINRYESKYILTDFTKEEENSILNAFNVVIPEEEDKAYVYSFYFAEKKSNNSEYGDLTFVLEIDGVVDYKAFFEANTARIGENGIYGTSLNELLEYYPPEYYITYLEHFYSNPAAQSEEHKEMISELKKCYNSILENRK